MNEYAIGSFVVLDRDDNGRYDPEIDEIMNARGQPIPTDSPQVQEVLSEIGAHQRLSLPLAMTRELHAKYRQLSMAEKIFSNLPMQEMVPGLSEVGGHIQEKIKTLREFVRLEVGLREFCTTGMLDAVESFALAGNVSYAPSLLTAARQNIGAATEAFIEASQAKAQELEAGFLGFEIPIDEDDHQRILNLALSEGIELLFRRAEGNAEIGLPFAALRTLNQAQELSLSYDLDFDYSRADAALEKASKAPENLRSYFWNLSGGGLGLRPFSRKSVRPSDTTW